MSNYKFTSTRPTTTDFVRKYSGSTRPYVIEVDDSAPVPLIVGIALAIFIGFVIIVCCICRRRSISSGSSAQSAHSNNYHRAPTADGTTFVPGGFTGGAGIGMSGGSYPMAPINSVYPPPQGQMPNASSGQPVHTGGVTIGQHQAQHPYPSLPPTAYTPPYPLGYTQLPSYMPNSHSHTSSSSGPSTDRGVTGFSPPPPAPPLTGMMVPGDQQRGQISGPGSSASSSGGGGSGAGGGSSSVAGVSGVGMASMGGGVFMPGGMVGVAGYPQHPPATSGYGFAGDRAYVAAPGYPMQTMTTSDPMPGGGVMMQRVGSPLPTGMTTTEMGHL